MPDDTIRLLDAVCHTDTIWVLRGTSWEPYATWVTWLVQVGGIILAAWLGHWFAVASARRNARKDARAALLQLMHEAINTLVHASRIVRDLGPDPNLEADVRIAEQGLAVRRTALSLTAALQRHAPDMQDVMRMLMDADSAIETYATELDALFGASKAVNTEAYRREIARAGTAAEECRKLVVAATDAILQIRK